MKDARETTETTEARESQGERAQVRAAAAVHADIFYRGHRWYYEKSADYFTCLLCESATYDYVAALACEFWTEEEWSAGIPAREEEREETRREERRADRAREQETTEQARAQWDTRNP